ncbi:MAG TPA: SpoIID/LytB domain-containing protein [Spirochaetota bacterium]|nr:SpoIID/LytB domain-containing protein [Spirochaetota bacterium]HOR43581.1 SpoIID/LytB domain-containing protein [Spirochaetota bacterium]HPK55741.1 SpoIID/LytB domain-containing protein [Spirochaetota bacterium]
MKKYFAIAFSCLILSCSPSALRIKQSGKYSSSDFKTIDVRIIAGAEKINIFTSAKLNSKYFSTVLNSKRSIEIKPTEVKSEMLLESSDGIIGVNGVKYRGSLIIRKIANRIEVCNRISLEDYLKGVVSCEMSGNWHIEALKAQAVAARTYAVYFLNKKSNINYDLDCTTSFQVYKGYSSESKSGNTAVDKTSGLIMTYDGEPVLSFFHSTCGGWTSDNGNVWSGKNLPYLKRIKCEYCSDSPKYEWKEKISVSEIKSLLEKNGKQTGKIKSINLKRSSERVITVIIRHSSGEIVLSGNEFRRIIGAERLRSLYFTTSISGKNIVFDGKGWGHGVGMCQYGAKKLAEKGKDYSFILKYYYSGINVKKGY